MNVRGRRADGLCPQREENGKLPEVFPQDSSATRCEPERFALRWRESGWCRNLTFLLPRLI